MRTKRLMSWVGGALAVLFGMAFGFYHFVLDWKDRPFCHKAVMFGFSQWMRDHGMDADSRTNAFPNINGDGADSLDKIRDQMGGHMDWARSYKYVPGLREKDPGEMVLMYFDRPTRWTWHGPPPTIFRKKMWIVVPVDFAIEGRPRSGPGELSERISESEFRERLRRTLDFVRTNERPHWQAVVAEHIRFLNSAEHFAP